MILYNNTKKTSGDGLDSYVRYKASFGKVIPPSTRKEIKDQSSISIEPPKYKEFLPLSQEDYITLSKYQLSQELTSNAITTVTDRQPEKVDKMLSGLSDYINNNVHDTNPEANVMFISQESFDLVQDHIIKNIYKIDPQIDQKIQENYNKHNPQSPALTTLSDKDLYLFQNDGYFVVFDSPKIQQELQSFNDDIKNIRETKPTSQEKETPELSKADRLKQLRGVTSPEKTNVKESWMKTRENFKDLKSNFEELRNAWKNKEK